MIYKCKKNLIKNPIISISKYYLGNYLANI